MLVKIAGRAFGNQLAAAFNEGSKTRPVARRDRELVGEDRDLALVTRTAPVESVHLDEVGGNAVLGQSLVPRERGLHWSAAGAALVILFKTRQLLFLVSPERLA